MAKGSDHDRVELRSCAGGEVVTIDEAGRGVQKLRCADVALFESRLAVCEVEVPEPAESGVEPECRQLGPDRVEIGAPASQRFAVVTADVVDAAEGKAVAIRGGGERA